jgi:hypothetical protein
VVAYPSRKKRSVPLSWQSLLSWAGAGASFSARELCRSHAPACPDIPFVAGPRFCERTTVANMNMFNFRWRNFQRPRRLRAVVHANASVSRPAFSGLAPQSGASGPAGMGINWLDGRHLKHRAATRTCHEGSVQDPRACGMVPSPLACKASSILSSFLVGAARLRS